MNAMYPCMFVVFATFFTLFASAVPLLDGRASAVTYTGDGTWYETGLGACGITNKDTDFIAAVGHTFFDTYPGYNGVNPNDNPICGKKITAHYGGKSVVVEIVDRCAGCNTDDLDFSPSAFEQLASLSVGRIHGVQWSFN